MTSPQAPVGKNKKPVDQPVAQHDTPGQAFEVVDNACELSVEKKIKIKDTKPNNKSEEKLKTPVVAKPASVGDVSPASSDSGEVRKCYNPIRFLYECPRIASPSGSEAEVPIEDRVRGVQTVWRDRLP